MSEPLYGGKTLQELLALCAAATPGPLFLDEDFRPNGAHQIIYRKGGLHLTLCFMATSEDEDNDQSFQDAQCLIAARNALPDLLARVQELKDSCEAIAGAHVIAVKRANDFEDLLSQAEQERDAFARRCMEKCAEDFNEELTYDAILAAVREEMAREKEPQT